MQAKTHANEGLRDLLLREYWDRVKNRVDRLRRRASITYCSGCAAPFNSDRVKAGSRKAGRYGHQ
jgi:hypothetical protein